jgi:pyruvate dehydrogenase E1 component alpha subunit
MNTGWTKDQLIAFEDEIAVLFNAGKIKAPVHLAGGNEEQLIDYFGRVEPNDWVLCSWRSHYHCLLAGVPPDEVRAECLAGRSIALCFPSYRVLSSAIVGGICPIAVGLGWAIKQRGERGRVHVFVGDMTKETGIYHECAKYAARHLLPVEWVIEDNTKSVCSDTQSTWGRELRNHPSERPYKYDLTRPHVGTGTWVAF